MFLNEIHHLTYFLLVLFIDYNMTLKGYHRCSHPLERKDYTKCSSSTKCPQKTTHCTFERVYFKWCFEVKSSDSWSELASKLFQLINTLWWKTAAAGIHKVCFSISAHCPTQHHFNMQIWYLNSNCPDGIKSTAQFRPAPQTQLGRRKAFCFVKSCNF